MKVKFLGCLQLMFTCCPKFPMDCVLVLTFSSFQKTAWRPQKTFPNLCVASKTLKEFLLAWSLEEPHKLVARIACCIIDKPITMLRVMDEVFGTHRVDTTPAQECLVSLEDDGAYMSPRNCWPCFATLSITIHSENSVACIWIDGDAEGGFKMVDHIEETVFL